MTLVRVPLVHLCKLFNFWLSSLRVVELLNSDESEFHNIL
jgi:hypothetical protein